MAGKKDQQKSFNNPFRNLKGLSVSAPEKKPAAPPAAPPPPPPGNDADLFAEEMERLGVERRPGATVEPLAPEPEPPAPAPAPPPPPATDRELFLSVLDGFDTIFEDEFPEEEPEEGQASPRRMRLLRRGRLVPEAKLDLHGLTREEARQKVRHFLDDACHQGLATVLIVTGWGRGSGGEPVLRTEIERYLAREAGAWVAEWGRAPRQYGGEGALVVFLKARG